MTEINIQRSTPNVDIDTATRTYHLPIASETQLGGIKVGDNLTIEEDGTLNADPAVYTLPVASDSTLGGIKVGNKLSISEGVLSVTTDSSLSGSSTNPIQNNTVSAAITSLTSTVQTNTNSIGTLTTNLGTLSNTVSTNTTNISTLTSTVNGHTTAIGANSDAITNLSGTVDGISSDVDDLDSRLDTAEGDIENIEGDITDINSSITDLEELTDTEHIYSYLLPVSTWTAGSITLERRGKMGILKVDIEGDLTIASAGNSIIYSFVDLNLYLATTAVLMTDDGAIIGKVDDQTNNFTLENISAHSQHITKVKGTIPLVFF